MATDISNNLISSRCYETSANLRREVQQFMSVVMGPSGVVCKLACAVLVWGVSVALSTDASDRCDHRQCRSSHKVSADID